MFGPRVAAKLELSRELIWVLRSPQVYEVLQGDQSEHWFLGMRILIADEVAFRSGGTGEDIILCQCLYFL
jgi:hypothetical protein